MKKVLKIMGFTVLSFVTIVVIALIIDISNDEEQAKEAAQKAIAEEKQEKKEKEEMEAITKDFRVKADEIVKLSNGVVPKITIDTDSEYLHVNVYVNELTWSRSTESEKSSFATTIGNSIEGVLSPHSVYVDILSDTNRDVVASQKLFGGWDIKR